MPKTLPTSTPDLTVIQLTADEALLFIEYQKRHAMFGMLESLGAFNVRNGSVTINFDGIGGISSVTLNQTFRLPQKA